MGGGRAGRDPGGVRTRQPRPDAAAGGSATFHGRDVFAPVAAHLGTGTPPSEVGRRLDAGAWCGCPIRSPTWTAERATPKSSPRTGSGTCSCR
ncbi:SAM-dependent chlorinase/fluorinase [Yinghuangia aomiensis]